eukprot:g634.t1
MPLNNKQKEKIIFITDRRPPHRFLPRQVKRWTESFKSKLKSRIHHSLDFENHVSRPLKELQRKDQARNKSRPNNGASILSTTSSTSLSPNRRSSSNAIRYTKRYDPLQLSRLPTSQSKPYKIIIVCSQKALTICKLYFDRICRSSHYTKIYVNHVWPNDCLLKKEIVTPSTNTSRYLQRLQGTNAKNNDAKEKGNIIVMKANGSAEMIKSAQSNNSIESSVAAIKRPQANVDSSSLQQDRLKVSEELSSSSLRNTEANSFTVPNLILASSYKRERSRFFMRLRKVCLQNGEYWILQELVEILRQYREKLKAGHFASKPSTLNPGKSTLDPGHSTGNSEEPLQLQVSEWMIENLHHEEQQNSTLTKKRKRSPGRSFNNTNYKGINSNADKTASTCRDILYITQWTNHFLKLEKKESNERHVPAGQHFLENYQKRLSNFICDLELRLLKWSPYAIMRNHPPKHLVINRNSLLLKAASEIVTLYNKGARDVGSGIRSSSANNAGGNWGGNYIGDSKAQMFFRILDIIRAWPVKIILNDHRDVETLQNTMRDISGFGASAFTFLENVWMRFAKWRRLQCNGNHVASERATVVSVSLHGTPSSSQDSIEPSSEESVQPSEGEFPQSFQGSSNSPQNSESSLEGNSERRLEGNSERNSEKSLRQNQYEDENLPLTDRAETLYKTNRKLKVAMELQGIHGIGPSTARQILEKYPDIEGIRDFQDRVFRYSKISAKDLKPFKMDIRALQKADHFRKPLTLNLVQDLHHVLKRRFAPVNITVDLVGGYGRGQKVGHDVDFLLCLRNEADIDEYDDEDGNSDEEEGYLSGDDEFNYGNDTHYLEKEKGKEKKKKKTSDPYHQSSANALDQKNILTATISLLKEKMHHLGADPQDKSWFFDFEFHQTGSFGSYDTLSWCSGSDAITTTGQGINYFSIGYKHQQHQAPVNAKSGENRIRDRNNSITYHNDSITHRNMEKKDMIRFVRVDLMSVIPSKYWFIHFTLTSSTYFLRQLARYCYDEFTKRHHYRRKRSDSRWSCGCKRHAWKPFSSSLASQSSRLSSSRFCYTHFVDKKGRCLRQLRRPGYQWQMSKSHCQLVAVPMPKPGSGTKRSVTQGSVNILQRFPPNRGEPGYKQEWCNERVLFDFLELDYKPPHQRNA